MEKNILGKYKLVLGLEIHLHINTDKKMFCRCDSNIYKQKPNTHTCPTCLGLPGALPVPNFEAIRKTQLLGLAFNCELAAKTRFDRKHYFYPDLPKGYQISQYKQPFCLGGYITLENGKKAEIERIHLEEDTAKSFHKGGKTLIDFNMSSMPLVEIVTKPVFESVTEASEFARKVQDTVKDLGLGEVNMEMGQMRLEPNISLRTQEMADNNELPKYKVEIKNINSFRFMEKAVTAEIIRQRKLLESGETPLQENRGYDENTKKTTSQRSKENAHDYRYFPEPDIPPMEFDKHYFSELVLEYKKMLANTPTAQKVTELLILNLDEKTINLIINNLSLDEIKKMIKVISKGQDRDTVIKKFINSKEVRDLEVEQIVKELESEQDKVSDEDVILNVVKKVVKENKDVVEKYLGGKESSLQFLIGMVMRETKGKADINILKKILLEEIGS